MRPDDPASKLSVSVQKGRLIQGILHLGYPLLIFSIFLWLAASSSVKAGTIRKLGLSTEHPGQVTLAPGHTTALSFSMKPDRVVVGAPEKVHVDFLGNDVIVSPVGRDPGNLLIYTKAGRYVIHFQLGSATHYDDVVEITESGTGAARRPLRLLQDSYGIEPFELKVRVGSKEENRAKITAWVSRDGRVISGEEITEIHQKYPRLRCSGCLGKKHPESGLMLVCTEPIQTLRCQSDGQRRLEITRLTPTAQRGSR